MMPGPPGMMRPGAPPAQMGAPTQSGNPGGPPMMGGPPAGAMGMRPPGAVQGMGGPGMGAPPPMMGGPAGMMGGPPQMGGGPPQMGGGPPMGGPQMGGHPGAMAPPTGQMGTMHVSGAPPPMMGGPPPPMMGGPPPPMMGGIPGPPHMGSALPGGFGAQAPPQNNGPPPPMGMHMGGGGNSPGAGMMGPGGTSSQGQGFGAPPPPGGVYPGALQPGPGAGVSGTHHNQNFVEDFASLSLGGGGPGGDQGVDPATFPRPGDDLPNPNTDLSCDPRYLRLTCGALPVNQSVKQRYGLPVGCIVRPLIPGENVPVAQFGSTGIVRCHRCRTYINPFVQFIDGGRRFRCNVCQLPNEVPVDYFCTLDANGQRRDVMERPELRHGTVEFLASQEYMVRPPMPPTYFFALVRAFPNHHIPLTDCPYKTDIYFISIRTSPRRL